MTEPSRKIIEVVDAYDYRFFLRLSAYTGELRFSRIKRDNTTVQFFQVHFGDEIRKVLEIPCSLEEFEIISNTLVEVSNQNRKDLEISKNSSWFGCFC